MFYCLAAMAAGRADWCAIVPASLRHGAAGQIRRSLARARPPCNAGGSCAPPAPVKSFFFPRERWGRRGWAGAGGLRLPWALGPAGGRGCGRSTGAAALALYPIWQRRRQIATGGAKKIPRRNRPPGAAHYMQLNCCVAVAGGGRSAGGAVKLADLDAAFSLQPLINRAADPGV